jgi:microcin C transport system substrate-binding protein
MSLSPGNEQSIYWGSWAANQQGSRNYAGIKHPAIDEVIKKISNAKNRSELIEYTKTLDRLIRAGHWIIPLYHDPLHRIAYKSGLQIPNELPLYGFNPWTTWQK